MCLFGGDAGGDVRVDLSLHRADIGLDLVVDLGSDPRLDAALELAFSLLVQSKLPAGIYGAPRCGVSGAAEFRELARPPDRRSASARRSDVAPRSPPGIAAPTVATTTSNMQTDVVMADIPPVEEPRSPLTVFVFVLIAMIGMVILSASSKVHH